jgi:hypothetical protein
MLNALVLFSVLASDLTPLRMPTMIARTTISPSEQMVKDMLEMRFREREVSRVWSSMLRNNLAL